MDQAVIAILLAKAGPVHVAEIASSLSGRCSAHELDSVLQHLEITGKAMGRNGFWRAWNRDEVAKGDMLEQLMQKIQSARTARGLSVKAKERLQAGFETLSMLKNDTLYMQERQPKLQILKQRYEEVESKDRMQQVDFEAQLASAAASLDQHVAKYKKCWNNIMDVLHDRNGEEANIEQVMASLGGLVQHVRYHEHLLDNADRSKQFHAKLVAE